MTTFSVQDELDFEALPERMKAYAQWLFNASDSKLYERIRKEIEDDIRAEVLDDVRWAIDGI
jgi:hypothetical protein